VIFKIQSVLPCLKKHL